MASTAARTLLLTALSVMLALRAQAQSAAILMDGKLDDWSPALSTFTDNNSPASGIDLLSMQVTNDDAYLYIRLTVGSEIDLQDDLVPQTIVLFIDADNNPATGTSPQSNYGAELRVRFDTRTCNQYVPASTTVSWSTLDLVPLPTTTGNDFEIAIARNAVPDGVHPLFTSPVIRVLFRELDNLDAMPNTGSPAFSYTFSDGSVAPPNPIAVTKSDASLVRISAWNVLADGITSAALQGQYQRMLTALAPDIIGFSECVSSTAAQVKTRMDAWLPLGGTGWNVVKDDYDMVIASRWPILQTWPSLTRQFAALIDLPSTCATDLLFTAAHLHCCTADGNRQNEADEYVQFTQDAKNPGGSVTLPANTPMVYAGDLNSVGFAQQMTTLLTGDIVNNATYGPDGAMDWDGSPLSEAEVEQTDARMAYTWRSNTSAYPSGRLDHLLFTDAAAHLSKSFTLRTEVMPSGTLAAAGLLVTDASTASDHFPLTGDFAVPLAGVQLSAKVFLEGPFSGASGLMHDSLRVKGLVPLTEPYTALGFTQLGGGGESTTPSVLNVTGNDAIVDWVLLELRNGNAPTTLIATHSALLQRDGDVVGTDGSSPVRFNLPAGSYCVAVRHRNHFGAMTQGPVALNSTPTALDFGSPATALYTNGPEATKAIGPVQALWMGDAARDGTLRYTGSGNDRDPILVGVGSTTPNNVLLNVYSGLDVNLDGDVRYTGSGNDRDPILVNVGSTTPNNTRAEQLP